MRGRFLAVAAAFAVAAAVWAQSEQPQGDAPRPPRGGMGMEGRPPARPQQDDMMGANFFPPELVMRHQKDIALTADQQAAIRSEVQGMAAKFTDLQWQMSSEQEALETLLKQDRPDEKKVLAQLDKLLAVEHDIKRLHIGTLVRIKNVLTPEQQAKLTELKKQMGPRGPGNQGPGDRRVDRRPPNPPAPPSGEGG